MKRRRAKVKLEDLSAFLDAQLPSERAAEVAEVVSQDRESLRLLQDYYGQMVGIRQLYNPVLQEPVPDALIALVRQAQKNDTGS